jgi:hypothetical protein
VAVSLDERWLVVEARLSAPVCVLRIGHERSSSGK